MNEDDLTSFGVLVGLECKPEPKVCVEVQRQVKKLPVTAKEKARFIRYYRSDL